MGIAVRFELGPLSAQAVRQGLAFLWRLPAADLKVKTLRVELRGG